MSTTTSTVKITSCDAPSCASTQTQPDDDNSLGVFLQGDVLAPDGVQGSGETRSWAACKPAHLKAAVVAVLQAP